MTLDELNSLNETDAREALGKCCGSARWTEGMIARRPLGSEEELLAAAGNVWWNLSESDWKEAFTHHPKIGDIESLKKKFAETSAWASDEQSGTRAASHETLEELAECNRLYDEKFGYIFIVCATGKSADDMLSRLRQRLANSPSEEIRTAAHEQAKITHLRLLKLLNSES